MKKKLIAILICIIVFIILSFNVYAKNGSLTDFITYNGITGKLWIPDKIDSSTGFIWCMPGLGGYSNGVLSVYDYVKDGLEKPRHVVFFVEYTNGSGSEVKANIEYIPDIIDNIKKDYNLENMNDEIYYYGFSKGSYYFGDGISNLGIWDEAILNDGGRASTIFIGKLKRVVVIQGAENNASEYDKVFLNTDVEYYMENFHGQLSNPHPKVNAWGATNSKYVYMSNTYYDKSLIDPKYGLNWFGADNTVETNLRNLDFSKIEKIQKFINSRRMIF